MQPVGLLGSELMNPAPSQMDAGIACPLPCAGAEDPTSLLGITVTAVRQEAGSGLVKGRPPSYPAAPNCFPHCRKMNLFIHQK